MATPGMASEVKISSGPYTRSRVNVSPLPMYLDTVSACQVNVLAIHAFRGRRCG